MAAQAASTPVAEPPLAIELPKPGRRALDRRLWVLAPVLFALVVGARFLASGFDNDHFRMIAQGRQLLRYGELPYRDFVDPGIFLQIWTSAALQLLFGDNLVGQTFFDLLILGLAAVLTFVLAARAAGSARIGLLMAILAVATLPRLKQHQVVFLPLLGLLLAWRYLERPSLPRLAALSLAGALAFLIRHDQGVYLAVPATVALLAAHRHDGWRVLLARGALCGALAAVMLAPFFVFLEANGGIVGYFRSASEYIRSEADRQGPLRPRYFMVDRSAPLFLIEPPPALPPGQVEVRWKARISAERRTELEQRYQLAKPRPSSRRSETWRYDIRDYSPGNIRALARDDNVDRVYGIDREGYRLDNEPRESFWNVWWRAFPLLGLRPAPGIVRPENAIPWLFWVFVALPVLALVGLAVRRLRARSPGSGVADETPKILAVVLLCLAMLPSLRDPLDGRLADVAAVPAILAAWLLGRGLGVSAPRRAVDGTDRVAVRRPRWAAFQRLVCAALAVTLVALTVSSVTSLPAFGDQLERLDTPLSTRENLGERIDNIMETLRGPGARDAPGIDRDLLVLAGYVQACTAPTDRLLVTWFAPEVYFYAKRGFAGRQIFWFERFYSSADDQARILASLRAHPTPVAIHRTERHNSVTAFGRVQAYLTEHYRMVHRIVSDKDSSTEYQVLVDSRRQPTGTYDRLPLPCFA